MYTSEWSWQSSSDQNLSAYVTRIPQTMTTTTQALGIDCICEVLLEWLFSMFLVNITSFNDVLINFMRICHVWREKYWMLRCLLSAIYSWYQWKWAHFYFKTGIPSTNVTFIAQSCSKELSFNSLDALYQIWNITITISHTKCMFVVLYVGPTALNTPHG